MTSEKNWNIIVIVALFGAALLTSGFLRFLYLETEEPPGIAAFATEIYIGVTILAAILLRRSPVPVKHLGFDLPFRTARYLLLAAIGVAVIQLAGFLLEPLWQAAFGESRNLTRFSDTAGSANELVKLMALNWTVAAFGEELAFRILLMRGIAYVLGDSRFAFGFALFAQALVFGLVHAYQGLAGIAGAAINGLIFGVLTLAARGAIWPAAIAHGSSNSIGIMQLYLQGH